MTNIKKTIEEFNKKFTEAEFLHGVPVPLPLKLKKDLEAFIIKALKAQEQEHQKVTDFLIKSHAFDMKELKEEHQKKLKEINEFGGDETDAYNLIDKLNEEK